VNPRPDFNAVVRRKSLLFQQSNLNFPVVHHILYPSSINIEWIQHVAMFVTNTKQGEQTRNERRDEWVPHWSWGQPDYGPHVGAHIHVIMLSIFVHIYPAHSLYATNSAYLDVGTIIWACVSSSTIKFCNLTLWQ
jgi:hypothetical protein